MDLKTEQMITANISSDVFAIILTMIPIAYLLNGKRYKQRLNQYFLGIAVSNVFMILGDLSDWMLQDTAEQWKKVFLLAGTALFYTASAFVLYFFARYITTYMRLEGKAQKICFLSQIQPHFLYNSLSIIYNLCETNPAAAKKSIRKFSDFLRGNMDSLKSHEPIPFEKELSHVMNFLYLEQQRFGERLQVIYQIEINDFFIPPLTLQPLVENAIGHGILHKKGGGTIMIRTAEAEVLAFQWPEDVLEAARKQPVDVAFLDIRIGGRMTGLQLAVELKKIKPDIRIIFVTGYSQYAVDAFAIHATGYLLKPVEKEDVERELTFIYGAPKLKSRIQVRTFGGFELYVDGQPVKFGRAKAKELLAYLVDRRGMSVTAGEACTVLFEDAGNTLSSKSYFRTIYQELVKVLKEVGGEEILRKEWNSYAVVPGTFDCDFYRFLEGNPEAVNQYRDDYLPAYSWAEVRNADLSLSNN